ncbi:hypothetical protein Tco_0004500 [Tanacetum coccineum]
MEPSPREKLELSPPNFILLIILFGEPFLLEYGWYSLETGFCVLQTALCYSMRCRCFYNFVMSPKKGARGERTKQKELQICLVTEDSWLVSSHIAKLDEIE